MCRPTSNPNTVDIVGGYTLGFQDLVQLWTSTVQHHRIETDAIEEAKAQREVI